MLRGNIMPRAHDAALQKRERGFDRVGVNVRSEPDVLFVGMVDRLMLSFESAERTRICGQFVGDDHAHIFGDVLADVLRQSARFGVLGVEKPQFAVALTNADDHFFVGSLLPAPVFSRAVQPAADVGFVHFDCSVQFPALRFNHRGADAMAEIPCGFVPADSKHPLNLAGRNALLRLREDERSEKPLLQGQVRIVEHCSRHDADLGLAARASQDGFAPLHAGELFSAAFRANGAVGPAQPFQIFAALAFAVKTGHKSRKVNSRTNSAHRRHGQSPMKKRKKKTDREVLKELFPPEIVREVDAILEDVDGLPRRENPTGKKTSKPWGRKWAEGRKSGKE